jgi:dCMP deaminase
MSNEELLKLAYKKALQSCDPSTQNAAFLATSKGSPYYTTFAVNGLTIGAKNLPERWERPLKYSFVEHAERASLYSAAYQGLRTKGQTLVCPWAACVDCARAIVQTGIAKLITHYRESSPRWDESIALADQILAEGGVEICIVDTKLDVKPILRNEELWYP